MRGSLRQVVGSFVLLAATLVASAGHAALRDRSVTLGMHARVVLDREVARVATVANERAENIGARRLQTVMATLLESVLYELPEAGEAVAEFSAADVKKVMDDILASDDLARYIL